MTSFDFDLIYELYDRFFFVKLLYRIILFSRTIWRFIIINYNFIIMKSTKYKRTDKHMDKIK